MVENDPLFKENVRNAFKKAKEDINRVDNDIISLKNDISDVKNKISSLKEELSKVIPFLEKISIKQPVLEVESSIGNEGVLSKRASEQARNNWEVRRSKGLTRLNKSPISSPHKEGIPHFFDNLPVRGGIGVCKVYRYSKAFKPLRRLYKGLCNQIIREEYPYNKEKDQ